MSRQFLRKHIQMPKFPDCFPKNFETDILPNNVEYVSYHAYRILKEGKLNRKAFISTFEEFKDKKYKPRGFNPSSPDTYSTSLFSNIDDIKNILKIMLRHNPPAIIAEGITEPCCGPCKKDNYSSHISWWIFEDASPETYFKVIEENEDE